MDSSIEASHYLTNEIKLPALSHTVEMLKLACDEVDTSIESINNRSGLGLTLIVTSFAVIGFQIKRDQVGMFGEWWWLPTSFYLIALLIISFGAYKLLCALQAKSSISAYSTNDLANEEWKKSEIDFFLKAVSNYRNGFNNKIELMHKKGAYFNEGLQITLIGFTMYFAIQLISSLFILNECSSEIKNNTICSQEATINTQ